MKKNLFNKESLYPIPPLAKTAGREKRGKRSQITSGLRKEESPKSADQEESGGILLEAGQRN